MAKPVVDGIESALNGTAVKLMRVSVGSRIGRQLAGRYGLRGVPTLLVFDGSGSVILRQVGRIAREGVLQAVGH